MRFLAAITVVLTVPVLVASFWGMNVVLPFGTTHGGFGMLSAVSLLLSLALVLVFRGKRWL